MVQISITELRKNISHYLQLSKTEDILVTKRGEPYVCIHGNFFSDFLKLEGCLSKYDDGRKIKDIIGDEIIEKNGINPKEC